MRSFLITCIVALLATGCLTYFIPFEGNPELLKAWWQEVARDSESLPFAPYNSRILQKSAIRTEGANEVIIIDQHLFWKGAGAKISPVLNENNYVEEFKVLEGGKGYSMLVKVYIQGAGSNKFKLGNPIVSNGAIVGLPIESTAKWNKEPVVYAKEEPYPFSGIVENEFPGGQIIEQIPYLSGRIHGTVKRWNEYGIPVSSKDYRYGKKEGTHIYWFEQTNDPEDYIPIKSKSGELYPTLWIKLREEAKTKFLEEFGTHKANEWVTFNYRSGGGEFPVRLLEHWKNNLKHGLFEGFDEFGNKTFKDDYNMGLRVKHKIFDKTKG